MAHRYSYTINIGPIEPTSLQVLHACDNRRCCWPPHLSLGTNSDNMKDCYQKGRHHWNTMNNNNKRPNNLWHAQDNLCPGSSQLPTEKLPLEKAWKYPQDICAGCRQKRCLMSTGKVHPHKKVPVNEV